MTSDPRDDASLIVVGNTDRVLNEPCRSGAYFYLYGYFLKDSALIARQNPRGTYPGYILSLSDPKTIPVEVTDIDWD